MNKTDQISYKEYFFFVFNHIVGFVSVLSFTDSTAKQDSWLVIICALLIAVPFNLVYAYLAKRFPSKTLLEIYQHVFGKVIGTVVIIAYIAEFHLVFSHYLNDLSEFYTGFVEPETPAVLFIAVAVLTAAFALKTGIQYLAKMGFVFFLLTSISVITTFLLLIGKMDFSNFLPVLRQPANAYLQSVGQFIMVPCCQTVYLLMLTPKLRDTKEMPKYLMGGVVAGVVTLLIVSIRNVAVLGPVSGVVDSPSYSAARMINIGDVFTRLDFAVSINITILVFFNVCILYYAAVKGLMQLFKIKSKLWAIIMTGVIGITLAMTFFDSHIEHVEFAKKNNYYVYSAFIFGFPPIALLTAKLRKLKDEPENGEEHLSNH